MAVGLVKTVREIKESSYQDWQIWSKELLKFLGVSSDETEKAKSYCFAWKDSFKFLKENLPKDIPNDITILFEYELPGREYVPDVVILLENKIVVLEFKATHRFEEKEIIQLRRYLHTFKTSHDVTLAKKMVVDGYLVRTYRPRDQGEEEKVYGNLPEHVLTVKNFTTQMSNVLKDCTACSYQGEWLASDETTIPGVREALSNKYKNGTLPVIKYLKDGDLGKTEAFINNLIEKAKEAGERGEAGSKIAIIVDGVPGSGKTYLGLQITFDHDKNECPAVYLSGNGPLVDYMQTVLTGKEYLTDEEYLQLQDNCPTVKKMTLFKNNIDKNRTPKNPVIVFDESQRAWDGTGRNRNTRNHAVAPESEVEKLLRYGENVQKEFKYCVLLCLFGNGQAIYKGEEKGLVLWQEAIEKHKNDGWTYYVSPKTKDQLDKTGSNIIVREELSLTTSIRNNYIDISDWVRSVIECKDLEIQKQLLFDAKCKGFDVYVIRHLSRLKEKKRRYVRKEPEANYGILSSSFVDPSDLKNSSEGIFFGNYMEKKEAVNWLLKTSRHLDRPASEFACQGLEIDWPIVLFGGDFYLKDGKWKKIIPNYKRKALNNPEKILENVYNVLLTRGRKGLILVIPEDPEKDENAVKYRRRDAPPLPTFQETYNRFVAMGVEPITDEAKVWELIK